MAIFLPFKDANPPYSSLRGIASDKRHLPKPNCSTISTCLFFSNSTFSPTIPISATSSCTYCGISSSRKKNTSIGKLSASVFKRSFTLRRSIPHSLRRPVESSYNLPDFWMAILSFITTLKIKRAYNM